MYVLCAQSLADFRLQARALLHRGIKPDDIAWQPDSLFESLDLSTTKEIKIPRAYLPLATSVACHCDGRRWSLLYRVLWRLHHGEPHLLEDPTDALMRELHIMAKQVGRDIHKMHAFVRFRETLLEDGRDVYLAWHRPDHRILTLAAPFFVKRFAAQRWGIATPEESCCWDGECLSWGEGMPVSAAPPADAVEDLWRTYYRNVFNPARIKIKMMKSEMPVRHWATLPETQDILAMLAEAPQRVRNMLNTAFYSSPESLEKAERIKNSRLKSGG